MEKVKNEALSEQAKLLDRYLRQYNTCKGRMRRLEIRRNIILREFDNPLSAVRYDGMPKGNTISVGAASLAIRLDEIDSRILEQRNSAAKFLLDAMEVLEFLPENETERDVLEARYIDGLNWDKVCKAVHLTRTPANNHWRRGLNRLLEFKKVQKILEDYKQQLDDIGELV